MEIHNNNTELPMAEQSTQLTEEHILSSAPENITPTSSTKDTTIPKLEYERSLAKAQAREAELINQINSLQNMRKEDVLRRMVNSWAVDPETVLALTSDRFSIDAEGQVFPSDAQGIPLRINGQTIDTEAFFKNFQKEKPYLVKASASRGAGSFTEGGGENMPGSIERLADLPMSQFIQAGGLS